MHAAPRPALAGASPSPIRLAVGVLLVAAWGVFASCRVDKLVAPPVEGVLMPSKMSVADSAPLGSQSLRIARIALNTSRPGRLSWRAERALNSPWLGFLRPTGNAPDSIEIQLNPRGLDDGVHRDTIILSTNNSEAPSVRLPIEFRVHPCHVTAVPRDTIIAAPLDGGECESPHSNGMFARLFSFSGTAGDSVTIELQSTGFDAQLILDTVPMMTGTPPLAVATACRGVTGDPCLTYFRLPATHVYYVEINGATPSAVGTFVLMVAAPSAPRLPTNLRQLRADSVTAVSTGAVVPSQSLVLTAQISDADAVDTLRLELELRPLTAAFTGTATHTSALVANGALATIVANVADDASYHWRARTADQTGRRGPWLSFGGNAETAADFTTAVPQPPAAPATMAQLRGSDQTPMPVGGANTTGTVVFRATVTDPDPGDQVRLEVEVRPVGTAFTNTLSVQSTSVASGNMAEAAAAGLVDNTPYHWQARVVDQGGGASAWTAFGGNAESATDFVVAVPATQLVFTAQPTSTTAGAVITPAIQVTARGADGNTAVSFSDSVALAIATNPGAGTLGGTLKVKAVLGVATFSNISINRTGTGYTLNATAAAVPGVVATSAAFNINPGAATQLAFTTQPTNEAAGAAITPAVVVTARDAQGNTASGFTGGVTIAIGTNPGGSTLTGTPTVTAIAGVATFSNLRLNKIGTGYTLTASATGLPSATSAAFNITPAAASVLVFTTQPSHENAGAVITPPIQVTARDPQGNTATAFTGSVTLAIATNPGDGALSGTTTVAATAGVATFAGLSIDKVGTGYTLAATAAGLTPDTSVAFNIGAAAASRLVFSVEPTSVSAGATIAPTIQVSAEDGLGNPVPSFTGTVTIAIGTNPGGGGLAGTLSIAAVGGIAGFGDLSINKSGVGYTLTASASGLTGAASAAFTITPATASKLAFTVNPTSSTAGAGITPAIQITARDAFDNTVTTFTGNVTVAIGTNPNAGTLSGATSVAVVAGVATFSGLSINRTGTGYTLTAAATGLSGATSTAFNITPGAATQLAFTVQPTTTVAAVSMAPAIQVTARDAFGNTATGFSNNITLSIGTNPGGGTLAGSTSVTPVGGVTTFSNLNINKTGTGYTLSAAATGVTAATSAAFNITPGAATKLVFTEQPTDESAGSAITPAVQVTARDAQDNTATGFTGTITLAIGANPGAGTLSGTTGVAAVAGVATFGNLSIDRTGTGYTLTSTATGLTGATSAPFNISAAPATLLAFTVQPANVVSGVAISPAVEVTARDGLGNVATGFTDNVTIAIGNNPGGGAFLGSITTVTAVAGVATFSNLRLDKTGVGYTLVASATGASTASSTTFNVTPAGATQLAFTVQPSNATAGVANAPAVRVTARDAQGNTATGFTGNVTMAIGTNPGAGTLSGAPTVAAAAGVATFSNLRINRTGNGYTLTAAATGLTGATSATFNISPAPGSVLVFTAQPTADTAGKVITPAIVVTARDSVGNTATAFTGTINVAISTNPGGGTLSGTTGVAAVAGVATFSTLSINRTGTGYRLSAASTGLTSATSNTFNILPNTPTQLFFTVQPSNGTAGATLTPAIQVTARDAQGNIATQYTGTVAIAIGANPASGTLGGTATRAAVAGVATFNDLTINRVGTGYTLTANDGGLTGATSIPFNIAAGGATQLAFTVQPGDQQAGAAITPALQVSALDAQGNLVSSFTGNVSLTIETNPGSGTLTGGGPVAAVGGVATFSNVRIDKVGTGYTLLAAASGVAGASSSAFTIVHAPASVLLFTVQPSTATAAATIAPAVQVLARDAFGNDATTFTGSVSIAIAANPGGGTLSGAASVAAIGGTATFASLSINRSGTGYTLSATSAGLTSGTSATFDINPGAPTQLAFTVQPVNTSAATAITPAIQVTARDNQGNTATSFVGNITIAIGTNPSGGALSGTTTVAAAAGVASFAGVSINLTGTGYTLTAAAAGLASTTSTAFNIASGGATQLVFTVQPSADVAGVAITPAVQVTARDAQGNTATSFTGSVTIAIGTNPGAGTLSGTPTVAAVAGVATFSNLRINRTGNGYTLTAAATGLAGATSVAFNISPAPATVLIFTAQPTADTAGKAMTPAIVVTARDSVGNTATSFTGTVNVAIGTNPGGSTLSGTTGVAAVAGVATFSTLSINRTGAGYTLTAAATGLAGATSTAFDIAPSAPSVLVFTVQPATSSAGAAITPAIQVTARDAQGNTATQFAASITLAIGTNPSSGILSGTTTVAATGGVASFSGLSINLAGTGYTLTAAAAGLTSATSAAFNIVSGSATQLAFTVQPSNETAGVPNAPAVQVTARDAQGNTVTAFTSNITIAIGANPGGGTLTGTPTVAAVAGVATFSNLRINRTGTGYTLVASATGPSSATSTPFTITPAPGVTLLFSVQPTSAVAGASITPAVQVTAQDSVGNTATGFTGNVTVAIGANPGAGTLSGAASVAAVGGVASFTGLQINRTGTGYTLTAAATGLTGATSAAFTITPGTATALFFTVQPSAEVAGAAIAPAVQVTARDAHGNTATAFAGNVTVAIGTNPGAGTLSGTPTVAAVAGVATFSNLRINRTGVGYTLTAAATGLTGATSATFDITPAPASVLVFTTQPTNAIAGTAIAPAVVVTARDSVGNTATSFTSNVTIAIGTNPGGATLSGAPTVAAVAGVATFSNLRINRTGTGYTLTATDAGPTSATSAAFNITPAPAVALVFTTQPTNGTAGAALTPAVVVTARDSVGNTATSFTSNVTIAIGTNPGGSTLTGTPTVAAVAGVATFSNLRLNRTGTGYTLTATDAGPTSATSTAFNIAPAPASVLVFSVQPANGTAGVAIAPAVQVTARDSVGNTATSFTGNVALAIGTNPGAGTLTGGGAVAAVAGVANFAAVSINRTGTGYTLVAAATGVTSGTSTAFNITPGTATALVFSVQPSGATAGATITPAVQVTAQDNQGNTATAFTGNVVVAIGTNPGGGTLSGSATVAAVAGVASFATLSINNAGVGYTLVATATGLAGTTSAAFTISAGAATQLVFTVQPSTTTAGVAISPAVQVTARDGLGNTATGFTANVTIAIGANPSGGAFRPTATTTVAAVAGIATFSNLRIDKVGTGYTLTASAAGAGAGSSGSFTIIPAPALRLAFTTQPVSTTAGVAIAPAVVVTAQDSLGNTAPEFAGNVSITLDLNPTGATLSGTTNATATAGVATLSNLRITKTGNGYTLLAASAGLISSGSAAFNIVPAPASQLFFTTQPSSAAAGASIAPAVVVTARDSVGNTATGFAGTVTIAIGANPGGSTLSGTTAVAAASGVATFSSLQLNRTGNGYTLTASATGTTGATSAAFNISAGTAAQLVFTVQPVNTVAAAAITPAVQVTARDNQGNTATSFTGSITIAIGSNPGGGALSGTATVAATAGVASFPGLSINLAGTGYTLTAAATGPTGATSTTFNITPGTASVLIFTVQPANALAGAAISPAVQVTARDAQGNTATGFAGNVTLAIGTNPGAGTLTGTPTVAAVAGVASFADLHINRTGTGYTLTATAAGPTGATSAAFNIGAGTASVLVFTVQPSSATAGVIISPAVQVTARDDQGNTATGFVGSISVAIGANPGAGTLSGTASVAAVAGVATFADLSINRTGTGYTLSATATGPTAATSAGFNIAPGTASVLVFTTQPVNTTAGVGIAPAVVVTARDNQGNTATAFVGNVTVAIGTNPGGGALSGTTTVAATAGVATFAGLSINLSGTGYTLTATAIGPTGATSTAFNITPGAATLLVFTQQPTTRTAGQNITPTIHVTARDNLGNTATGFVGTITLAIGTNPAGGTLSGTATQSASGGSASFPSMSINAAGTGYTLTAAATGLTGATSVAFNITPAAASVLVFTVQPASATAGASISPPIQVTARDNLGNTATSFTGSVSIAIGANPGAGTLSGTASLAAVAGVATFADLQINRTGSGYTLTAAAGGLTGATSAAFNITPGAASQLVFTVQPTATVAGAAITPAVQVTARDNQGNTATGFVGTVTIAIGNNPGGSALTGTLAAGASAGVASFADLHLNRTGTGYTLTATAAGPAGGTSGAFDITPGTASVLVFTVQPSDETAGVANAPAVQVTARDNQGNTATAFTGSVSIAIGANPGGGTLSGTPAVAAVAGVATFTNLRINRTGAGYTLVASAPGGGPSSATSTAFSITPAPGVTLVFTTQPASTTAGVAIAPAVVVTARDSVGNTATSFTGNVTVGIAANPGGGTLSGTNVVAAAAGVATFSTLSINLVGTGYTLSAAATGLTGTTSTAFNITAGTASVLVFTQQPTTTTAGAAIAPAIQVTARDNQGNTATGFTGAVTLAIGANPGGGTLSGANAVAATAGVASFAGLSINLVGTGYTLTATATGPTGATSSAFNINAAAASVLVFTVQPSNATAGVGISPAVQVTARDAFGNTATGFTGSVTVAIGTNPNGGTLSGTTAVTASAGVASFAGISINKSGTGYTLTTASTGLTGATSTAFNITAAAAATIAVQAGNGQSATVNTAVAVDPAVIVHDAFGNVVQGVSVTFTVTGGGGTISPASPATLTTNAQGIATLTTWTLGTAAGTNNNTLSAASGTLAGSPVAFSASATPGAASALVFTQQPTSATAGAAIAPAVQVTARDAFGNTATSFSGTVTVAIGTNPSGGTLSGTTAAAASAGVAGFLGLSINLVGTGYTLTATATGPTAATSAAFNITPGAAATLVFTQQPTTATAGVGIAPAVTVTARDNQGNTATGFTGNVTLAIATNPSGGTLSGTNVVAAAAGVATFPGVSVNLVGTGYTLSATATGPTAATSSAFNITPGAAAVLVFTQQPTTEIAGVAISPAVHVTARDNQGNTATAFTGAITVAIGTNPSGGTLSGTAAVAATAGVATFANLSINLAGTGYTLTATATGPTAATSAAFNITPGTAATLVFTQQPTTEIAGVAIAPAVQVTARDNQGNTAIAFTGTITVAIGTNPGGGTLSGTAAVAATAGVANFANLSINLVGTGYTLTATATGPTAATSAAFNITPGTAATLVFTQQPTSTTAGVGIAPAVQVTARDNQGNTATGFTGTITVAIGNNPGGGALSGTNAVAATAGVASFPGLTINKSGTGYTLAATAIGPTGATSTAFNISAAAAATIAVNAGNGQSATVNTAVAVDPSVIVHDAFGNAVQGVSVTFTVTGGGGAISPASPATLTTGANGVATLTSWTLGTTAGTGNNTVSATSGTLTGSPIAFTASATPGAASVLVFTQQPSSATAGVAIAPAVQVTARDAFANTATAFTGTIAIAIGTNPSAGTLSGTAAVAATAGVASFNNLSINAAGTGYTLTATATGPTAVTSSAFNITPGTAAVLVFTQQPTSTTAGASITPAIHVTARDNLGNTATAFTGTVTLAIGSNPGGGTLSGTNAVAAAAGVATFAGLSINLAGTGYTLSATATGPTGATSAAFNITPGTASVLVFTQQPTTASAGSIITPAIQVTARDNQGNTATAFSGSITVAIATNPAGGTLSGTSVIAASAGVATFPGLSINAAGTGYTLAATATGPSGATSAAFNITPGAASVLVFTQQPTSATAGSSITPTIQVTAQDNLGNTATGFVASITIAIGANPGGATLTGTNVVAATAGVANFPGLSLNRTGTGYTLTATATGATTGTSAAFNITPGTASILVFTQQPTSTTAGAAITPAVQVTARDNQGNTATAFAGTITLAIGTNPGGGTLSGTNAVTATAGIASFPGININKSGTGYTLAATATGPTGATSTPFNITAAAPASIALNAGQGQSATVATAVAVDPSVIVRDAFANPVQGVSVTFTVTGGGGAIVPASPATLTTDANGIATLTSWTLGSAAGSNNNTLSAASGLLTGSPVAFTASATPGPISAAQSTVSASPGVITASTGSSASTVTVTVRDQFSNPITGVSVVIASTGTGNAVTQPLATTNASGVAAGSISSNVAETKTISATANGVGIAQNSALFVQPAAVSAALSTVVATSSITASNGASQSTITVTARDQFNNLIQFATVVLAATGTGNTLTQPAATTNASGVATGTLSSTVAEGKTVSATINSVAITQTAAVTVNPAAASALVFTQQPTSATAGVAIAPAIQVTARDSHGNTATSFVGTITVAIGTNPGAGTLSGTNAVAATAGVASFPGISINKSGTGYTLTATATGPTSATSAAFTITAAAAATIAVSGGNGQSAAVNTAVAVDPSVIVQDAFGNGVQGVSVTFTVTGGGGSISPASPATLATGANGIATLTSWTLGTAAGTNNNTLSVTSGSLSGSPLAFTATATAGPATQIAVQAGNGQSATVGTAVATPPAVIVRDQFGNPVNGVSVVFTVTSGGGSTNPTSPATIPSNSSGIATLTSWTLGILPGSNTLSAANGALAGSPVVFTATATVGVPTQMSAFAGNGQSAAVGTPVATPPAVIVRDVLNNPVAGVTVVFTVTGGDGTISPASPASVITDGGGVAALTSWTLGATLGLNSLSASSGILIGSPVPFTATGVPGDVSGGQSSLNALPGSVVASTGSATSTITVTARDGSGNPVSGRAVLLSATGSGNTVTQPGALTNASGVTTGTLSSTIAGTKTISATIAGVPITQTANVTILPAAATSMSIASDNGQTAVVGSAVAIAPAVLVRDQFNNPVPNVNVVFTVTGGAGGLSPPGPATIATNASGVATLLSWTLGTVPGVNTLSVTSSGLAGSPLTFTATAVAGPVSATQTTVVAAPVAIVASNTVTSTITVTARDQFNNPISGATVVLSATGSGNTLTQPVGTTNASGVATGTLRSTVAQVKTLSATVNGVAIVQTATVTVNPAALSAAQSTVVATPNSIVASTGSTTSTITVTARDAFTNPLSGATVVINATGGGNTLTQPAAVTGPNGATTGTFASTVDGNHTVSATINGVSISQTAVVAVTAAAPASIATSQGNGQAATVGTAVAVAPRVLVRDQFDNPVPGAEVVFAVASGGGTTTPPAPATIVTDANGFAAITWTLGTTIGSNSLTATSAGLTGSPRTFTATGTAGPAAQITILEGNNQSANAGATVPTAPAVLVRDQYNNRVIGVSVVFTITTGGGTLVPASPATIATNQQGVARVTSWTLGAVPGTNTLRAETGSLSPVVVTALGTVAVSGATSTVTAAPGTIVASTGVNTSTITVTARDAASLPIEGATVVLAVSGGGTTLTQPIGPTNASGVATGTLSATQIGVKSVSATINQVTVTQAAPVTVTAAGAVSMTPSTGDGQTVAAGTLVPVRPGVVVRDQFGNVVSGINVVFTITSGGGTLAPASPATITTNNNGIARVTNWFLGTTPGTNTLSAANASLTGSPIVFTATGVTGPPSAAQSSVSATPNAITASAGSSASTITVTARDQFNNPIVGASVALGATGGGVTITQPATTNASGVTTGTVSATAAGVKTIAATIDGVLITQTAAITVSAGPVSAAQSTVVAAPIAITASNGTSQSTITVTARDQFNNVIPNATVALAATGGGNILTQPAATTNASGVTTGTLSSTVAEGKTVSATVNSVAIIQTANVTVNPAAAAALVFTQQPTITLANTAISPPVVVTVRDAFGNTVTGFAGTVAMTIETDASLGGNAVLAGAGPITVVNGTATFTNLQIDQLGIGYTLRATATGPLSVVSAAFTIL